MSESKKKHILEAMTHFVVGFYLAVEGYAKITEHDSVIGSIILGLGVILLGYFIYDLRAKRQGLTLKVMAHLFEGTALAFTTYIFFREGTRYIKYVNLLAAIAMFVSVIIMLRERR
jgi:hypothetical protein